MQSATWVQKLYEYQRSFTDLGPNHSDSIFLNLFSSINTDFNISSALRWAIQDQWSSGFSFQNNPKQTILQFPLFFQSHQWDMVYREETRLQVTNLVAQLEKGSNSFPVEPVVKSGSATGRITEAFQQTDVTPARPVSLPSQKKSQTRSCLGNSLFHAVYKCRYQKTKFLLERGFVANSKNDYGYNVLFAALQIESGPGRRRMFRLLLDYDVDPFELDHKYKRNTLHWAAKLGRKDEINILFDSYMGEFDFHQRDNEGMTPLHLATCSGYPDVVKTLVKEMVRYGTSVDVTDHLGLTPYLHAKRMGYEDIAEILRDDGKASASKADDFMFKKADEWREIGLKERSRNVLEKRMSNAAIYGRMKIASNDAASDTQSVTSNKKVAFVPESIIKKHEKCSKSVDFALPPSTLEGSNWRLSRLPRQVYSDITKTSGYRRVSPTWDLEKMMDSWEQQHTRSFRSPVVPKVTFEEKIVTCGKKRVKESRRLNRKAKGDKWHSKRQCNNPI